jgi:hypothetical protein
MKMKMYVSETDFLSLRKFPIQNWNAQSVV